MNKPTKKAIVYIDGENFIHRAIDLLGSKRKMKRDAILALNLALFVQKLANYEGQVEIRYYTTKVRLFGTTGSVRMRLSEIVAFNSKWIPRLYTQKVQVIRAGILRARVSDPCPKCGHTVDYFVEKGVDVRLAVDMVLDSHDKQVEKMYVLSSDLDLLPAIQAVKQRKKKMVYIASAEAVNGALVATMAETLTFTKEDIEAAI